MDDRRQNRYAADLVRRKYRDVCSETPTEADAVRACQPVIHFA